MTELRPLKPNLTGKFTESRFSLAYNSVGLAVGK